MVAEVAAQLQGAGAAREVLGAGADLAGQGGGAEEDQGEDQGAQGVGAGLCPC